MAELKDIHTPQRFLSHDGLDATYDASEPQDGEFGVRRELSERHISFIAIAGTIGTGLFLNSGKILAHAGPAGMLIAFSLMGMLVSVVMMCLGEMVVFSPEFGGFITMGETYVDPALGFAMSVNSALCAGMTIPTELTAIAVLVKYWRPDLSNGEEVAIILAGLLLIVFCNIVAVKFFGEVEFFFCGLKIVTLVGLIVFGICVNCGAGPTGHYIGGRNWLHQPFNTDFEGLQPSGLAAFLGFWSALTGAAFAYGGVEGIAVLAGEAKSPRRSMASATRNVFYRIVGLYLVSVLMIGLNVARDDPMLLSANAQKDRNANGSAWVLMARTAGVKVLPDVINGVVITSAFSAGNEQMYIFSRTIMTMAKHGYLPLICHKTSRFGTPIVPTLVAFCFGLLGFLTLGQGGATQAFTWLTNLSALATLLNWLGITFTFILYRRALHARQANLSALPFRGFFQPYAAYITIVFIALVILFNGFASFLHTFKGEDFAAAYINIPIYFLAFGLYKLVRQTRLVKSSELDLSGGPPGVVPPRSTEG